MWVWILLVLILNKNNVNSYSKSSSEDLANAWRWTIKKDESFPQGITSSYNSMFSINLFELQNYKFLKKKILLPNDFVYV